jgi:anti-sigma regulatory factor (Ser/Thr protein kinase)
MPATVTTSGHRLVLRTSLAEIDRLAAWVDGIASQAALPADTIFAVQLCLEEAVANAIMYGGASDETSISIDFMPDNGGATVVIEDSGRPFDPTSLPSRVKPASLEESRIGELGVHLMRQYSSSMRYERLDGRNRLTLTFESKPTSART